MKCSDIVVSTVKAIETISVPFIHLMASLSNSFINSDVFRSGITENIATVKAAFLCYKVDSYSVPKVCSCISLYWRLSHVLCFNSWDFLHLEEFSKAFQQQQREIAQLLVGYKPTLQATECIDHYREMGSIPICCGNYSLQGPCWLLAFWGNSDRGKCL